MHLNILEIDPDSNKFNKKFKSNFKTQLFFQDLCECS
jgi:hypothetical protein